MTTEKLQMPIDSSKVCGSCRFLKRPIYYSNRLLEACEKAVKTEECTETLAELTYEVLSLHRKAFWCNKNRCWTHILDNCSLWQPKIIKHHQNFEMT